MINNMKSASSERASNCSRCLVVCRCSTSNAEVGTVGMVLQFCLTQVLCYGLTQGNTNFGCSVLGDPRFGLAGWNGQLLSCITLKRRLK